MYFETLQYKMYLMNKNEKVSNYSFSCSHQGMWRLMTAQLEVFPLMSKLVISYSFCDH